MRSKQRGMILVGRGKAMLSPAASPSAIAGLSGWWKQGDWIAANERASQWNDSSGNARHLLQATGANQPIALPWSGESYWWRGATAGSSVNLRSSLTVSPTGNLTAEGDIAPSNWVPTAAFILCYQLLGNNGFYARIENNGVLKLYIGDGVSVTGYASTVATGLAANVRATYKIVYTDGPAGNVKFYINGVQLGATVNTTKTLASTNTQNLLTYGGGASTSANLKAYSFWLHNGAGTTYAQYNLTGLTEGFGGSFLSTDGNTWTILGTANTPGQIVSSPQIVGDGAAYFMRASYVQAQPWTRFYLLRQNAWVAGNVLVDGGGVSGASLRHPSSGGVSPEVAQNFGAGGFNKLNAVTLNSYHAVASVGSGAASALQADTTIKSGENPGTNAASGLTVMADGGTPTGGSFAAVQFKEIIEYGRALSQPEINQVMRYLSRVGKLGLAI